MSGHDPRILVALGTGEAGEVPTVILGVTTATWADLAGGKAQDIDLEKLGIPAKLLIMRGKSHEDIVERLSQAVAELTRPDRLDDGQTFNLTTADCVLMADIAPRWVHLS